MTTQTTKQNVLVTGGSSGIGQGIAIAFGQQGANVVVNYHSDEEGANFTLQEIKKGGGNGFIYKADVSNEEEVTAMFKRALEEYKTIDVLINNAGIQKDNSFAEMSLEEWNKVISTNLTGHFL
jgi:glucose 1-dehydrogenase